MSAVPADSTPENILVAVRDGARLEAQHLRRSGSRSDRWDELGEDDTTERPPLRLVPQRKRVLRLTTVLFCVAFLVLLSLASFQVVVTQQQTRLDRAERQAELARDRYDDLRRENSLLRDSARVRTDAASRGFVRPKRGDLVTIDAQTVAQVAVALGPLADDELFVASDPLARHKYLKRVLAETRGDVQTTPAAESAHGATEGEAEADGDDGN